MHLALQALCRAMASRAYFCRECHAALDQWDWINGRQSRCQSDNLDLWRILFSWQWLSPGQRRCFYISRATATRNEARRYGCYEDYGAGVAGVAVFRSSPSFTNCTRELVDLGRARIG